MVTKIKDELAGYETDVDAGIRLAAEIKNLEVLLEQKKVLFRKIAGETIGVNETSIMLLGSEGKVRVSFCLKQFPKWLPGKTEKDLPAKLKKIFMEQETKYVFVKNAVELSDAYPDILNYISMDFKTPTVTFPEVISFSASSSNSK